MPDTSPATDRSRPEDVSDRPFTEPETDDGMGPTLGEDVSPEHERAEDARYRREQEHEGAEHRSFDPTDPDGLRGAPSH